MIQAGVEIYQVVEVIKAPEKPIFMWQLLVYFSQVVIFYDLQMGMKLAGFFLQS